MAAIDPEAAAYVGMAGGEINSPSRFQRAMSWARTKSGINLGNLTHDKMMQSLIKEGYARPGQNSIGWSLGRVTAKGALSAVAPMGLQIPGKGLRTARGFVSQLPKGLQGPLRFAGRAASKWLGPAMLGYRLGTEVTPDGGPFGGGSVGGTLNMMDKAVRITGEEVSYAAMGALGAAVGTMVMPGVGTIIGGAIGIGVGLVGGAALSKVWNTGVSMAEVPLVAGKRGFDYLVANGRRARRLELGGRVSAGNRTQQAMTMRQAALGEIYRSGINQRSILSREASYMHLR